jgi:hypothetical protein
MTATAKIENPSQRDGIPTRSTLLSLVLQLQRNLTLSEDEVIRRAMRLVNNGRVVLTGSFAGQRLEVY